MESLKTERAFFFRENSFSPKFGQNGPKWPQNRVFWIFWNILSLVFLGNSVKLKAHIVINIPQPIQCMGKFWFSSYGPKCCQPIKLQDSLKCNISRKKWMMKFIFGMRIKIKVSYKLILSTDTIHCYLFILKFVSSCPKSILSFHNHQRTFLSLWQKL